MVNYYMMDGMEEESLWGCEDEWGTWNKGLFERTMESVKIEVKNLIEQRRYNLVQIDYILSKYARKKMIDAAGQIQNNANKISYMS
jgi:hypothetical protein